MPFGRRVPPSLSIFNHRSVVVQESDSSGIWCPCTLSLGLDRTKEPRMGNILLRQLAHFEGFDDERSVSLRVLPVNLERMHHEYGDANNIPSAIHDHFAQNNPIRPNGQVLTLVLDMSAHGRVIVPSTATVLTPKQACRRTVLAFQRLCQATKLLIYIPADHITEIQKADLQQFNLLAHQRGALTSMPLNLRRIYHGSGARETTWEVFNILELPPAYSQQLKRATNKHARTASPDHTPKRRAIDFSRSAKSRPAASISNTDTDTDFSANALSPLPASPSHEGVFTALHNGTSAPSSGDVDLVHLAVRGVVQDALPNVVEDALRDMLPNLLKTTVQRMLPQMLHDAIRGLRPWTQRDRASETSQSSTEQDKDDQHPLTVVIEPIVQEQLPTVVRKVMDDDGTYDDLIYEAQQQIELVIREEKDDALDQIREERDICVKDVQEMGTIAQEMLERTASSSDGERDPQRKAILQAILRTVRSTISGESTQSDPLRFTFMRFEGGAPASGESTEDAASTIDTPVEDSPSTRANSLAYDGYTAAGLGIESEDGQVESNISSPSARLLRNPPSSRASSAGAQLQASEGEQVPSGSIRVVSVPFSAVMGRLTRRDDTARGHDET
ncbi:hypothetical protein B0J12DRAFT_704677 [Macrophomina phaseolina]|uniref:Uncharacterized protein n=1 Tax=Macrophomina phaseolina TaxID=35725 RepID=A0ABQ8FUX2_9PEZI|nr:hypothetical protein B0J12DRAFT_704677 [Macrophomina phaseolina]